MLWASLIAISLLCGPSLHGQSLLIVIPGVEAKTSIKIAQYLDDLTRFDTKAVTLQQYRHGMERAYDAWVQIEEEATDHMISLKITISINGTVRTSSASRGGYKVFSSVHRRNALALERACILLRELDAASMSELCNDLDDVVDDCD